MSGIEGRSVMVTGASSGIGRVAAEELAKRGARLILVCRDPARGSAARDEICAACGRDDVELLLCDFASQASIRKAAGEFLASQRPLHVLLNNAGVFNAKRRVSAEDGLEETFAVNHLGYFLLTNLLLERIVASAPARIVNVASEAYRFGDSEFEDPNREGRYRGMRTYGRSKLANLLFTSELARRLEGSGVTVNALHPGFVATGFGANNKLLRRFVQPLMRPFGRNAERGAESSIYLCGSPEVEGRSGGYYYDCKELALLPVAQDSAAAQRLWTLSERLTGLPR